ncbi:MULTISPECIES: S-layer homology domain-containing protein [unclassified Paenibacillus]|jgi:predicted peptidase|uniref:S-layer homology domain-containing protein n=1 Tax=unclassified Paenibacillus TaxID=185978 RepID=UPI0004F7AFEE|nr:MULTISPECIES: S-layer homology domain-containing protein [unclassified Paenibacillus]AIQ31403.1 hypothetical protein P40081_26985 [Paenibacillus sp. FSL P4-0081]OMF28225.1 hypothetical protein BK132_14215 [Paenibacillus sp. FSL H8-0259]
MQLRKGTGLMLSFVLAVGTILTGGLSVKAEAASPMQITANTYIGDTGRMVESFDLQVSSAGSYADLRASDFVITGNFDGYPVNENNETVQNDYADDGVELSWADNILSLKVKPFKYSGGPVSAFAVTNGRYPELSFNKESVTVVKTRTFDDFVAGEFTGTNGEKLNYRLKLTESTAPQPLIVWLHGGGEVGTDNLKQLTENKGAVAWTDSGYDTSVLAVQFPENYGWKIYNNPEELSLMRDYFEVQAELIKELIVSGKVDPNRIYVVGVSSGGGGALRFLTQYPELFAGSIIVAAKDAVADYTGSVDKFKSELKDLTDVPVWLVHAQNDPITDSRTSTLTYEALTGLGNNQAKLTIYDDAFLASQQLYGDFRHCSWIPVFNDKNMLAWLFEQKKPAATSVSLLQDAQVTRAELAALLADQLKLSEVIGTDIYTDTVNSPEDLAIRQNKTAGIMKGTGAGLFNPDLAVTRAQLAMIADNVMRTTGQKQASSVANPVAFKDVPNGHWASEAIGRSVAAGILNGDSATQFAPNRPVTGAEATKFVELLTGRM